MKLLFDTSVWVEHLRRGILTEVVPALRGKVQLWCDSVVTAELAAGCRNKRERKVVAELLAPFVNAGRVAAPSAADFERAAHALSMLRERGRTLSGPALLDALVATAAVRLGALLVTFNRRDFERLAEAMPLRLATWESFEAGYGRG